MKTRLSWVLVGLVVLGCEELGTRTDPKTAAREAYLRTTEQENQRLAAENAARRREEERYRLEAQLRKADAKQSADEAVAAQLRAQQAQDDQARVQVEQHRKECADSYPMRFRVFQATLAKFGEAKALGDKKCKDLAAHCTTSSLGHSICHGLTPREQEAFDDECARWPDVKIFGESQSEACDDVDPAALAVDFSWTPQHVAGIRAMKDPPVPR